MADNKDGDGKIKNSKDFYSKIEKLRDEHGRDDEVSKKKCPFCAELIRIEAVKCRFCGEWLDKSDTEESYHR